MNKKHCPVKIRIETDGAVVGWFVDWHKKHCPVKIRIETFLVLASYLLLIFNKKHCPVKIRIETLLT